MVIDFGERMCDNDAYKVKFLKVEYVAKKKKMSKLHNCFARRADGNAESAFPSILRIATKAFLCD
jgi:hypothetical protein